jgi:hypothetical protein
MIGLKIKNRYPIQGSGFLVVVLDSASAYIRNRAANPADLVVYFRHKPSSRWFVPLRGRDRLLPGIPGFERLA